jgi:methionyl-tRNA synthetase
MQVDSSKILDVIVPASRKNDLLHCLAEDQSFEDISVSRLASRVKWGIQVPSDPLHVIYVWIDALVNYLTVLGYPGSSQMQLARSDAFPQFQIDSHVIGKDIAK